jgi:hypothetical protein
MYGAFLFIPMMNRMSITWVKSSTQVKDSLNWPNHYLPQERARLPEVQGK